LYLTVALTYLVPTPSLAQRNTDSIPYQFQFVNPGARSLALGGAFTGLGDDATAVFANPAGLTILGRPEVSIEIRRLQAETEYLAGGREGGAATGRGIDLTLGPLYATTESSMTSPAFLSVVIPRSRFVVAVARAETLRVKRVAESQGLILRFNRLGEDLRDGPSRTIQDLGITSYGVTVAGRVSDSMSVGFGVSVARLRGSTRELLFPTPSPTAGPSFLVNFSPVDLNGPPVQEVETEADDNTALEGRIGFLWRPGDRAQIGVSYRRGPHFTIARGSATQRFDVRPFKVPDVVTTGIMVRPTPALAITSDVSVVDYQPLDRSAASLELNDAKFPLAVEVRGGVEYVFTRRFSPAIRVGAWREPFNGPVSTLNDDTQNLIGPTRTYPERPAVGHVTFGGGFAFSERFELNAGVDLSSTGHVVSTSAIVRFAR
jgi:long-subunit fatty acid transport protein